MKRSLALPLVLSVAAPMLLAGCPQGSGEGGTAASSSPEDEGSATPEAQGGGATDLDLPAWKAELQPRGEQADMVRETEQVFRFNNGSEPETLDPHIMTGVPEHTLAMALFEGLTTHHPETLEPVPGVATSWDLSEDRTVYTFHLREDARWSDGEPITAEDFRASWRRAVHPATASQYAYQLYPIENAEAFNKQETKEDPETGELVLTMDFSEVGVEAVDDHTLRVTLANPCPYFLDLACFETLMPVPMEVVEEHGDDWTRAEHIVSNGPFVLESWEPNRQIVMVRNEEYWDRDFVKLDKIVAHPYDDMDSVYKLFEEGKIDWMRTVPASKIDEVQRLRTFYNHPYLGSYFYRINVTKPPLDDVRVRKALSLAINREVITRDVTRLGETPASWFTPRMELVAPGGREWTYEPPEGLAYDRERARELLAEAGYPGGEGFPELELLYNTLELHKQVAEVVVQQWRQNLGIPAVLRNAEWKVYLDEVDELNYDVSRAGWIGDYLDPNTFLDMWVSGGGNNRTGWSNEEYDRLIREAGQEPDIGKRKETFQEAERILIEEELPVIPLYIYVNKGLLAPEVRGFDPNIRDLHPFQYIWMEPTR